MEQGGVARLPAAATAPPAAVLRRRTRGLPVRRSLRPVSARAVAHVLALGMSAGPLPAGAPPIEYRIVNTPDTQAFTQGLVFAGGALSRARAGASRCAKWLCGRVAKRRLSLLAGRRRAVPAHVDSAGAASALLADRVPHRGRGYPPRHSPRRSRRGSFRVRGAGRRPVNESTTALRGRSDRVAHAQPVDLATGRVDVAASRRKAVRPALRRGPRLAARRRRAVSSSPWTPRSR